MRAGGRHRRPRPAEKLRPVVGLTAYVDQARWGVWEAEATVLHQSYVDRVVGAGGLPLVVPPYAEGATDVLGRLDALVVAGGPDVDPRRYGDEVHPRTGPARVARDEAELVLLRESMARGIPVLGICRGMQLLNVACGGTLSQHLPDAVGHEGHQPAPGVFGSHPVEVAEGSLLAKALGAREVEVASYHHQGIDRVGEGLRPVAWAPDDSVEGVERTVPGFVVGVLWHPEETGDDSLFAALVRAARADTG